ncbi:MAG: DUF4923 family protein [Alistipes sp.]|nr:DUF4923 family protein [Alistipes sp.]
MKKLLLLALLLPAVRVEAQSWKDLLTKIAATAADDLTDGQLTRYALTGTWNYTAPGVKFESEDLASELSGAALQTTIAEKLESTYRMVGIRPGACSFVFEKDDTFTATFGTKKLGGSYEFDPSTHRIALCFAKGTYNLGTVEGHAYVSGTDLQLVFPVTKLVKLISALGSKIASLATIAKLLESYENVYIGFEFAK